MHKSVEKNVLYKVSRYLSNRTLRSCDIAQLTSVRDNRAYKRGKSRSNSAGRSACDNCCWEQIASVGEWRFDARRSASRPTYSTTHKSTPVYVGSTTSSTPDSNFWKRWATCSMGTHSCDLYTGRSNGFGQRLRWRWPSKHWRRRRDRQRDWCQRDGQLWGVSGSAARTSPCAGAMRPSAILQSVYSAPGTYIGTGCPICREYISTILGILR